MMIDAMVPAGSSGSPLLSADGTVVGMVYAEQMRPSFEIPTGMGWAIPSRDIRAAVDAFRKKRRPLGQ
jgi:S1-C subfamily serine protease